MRARYPILLDVSECLVVIVGGGAVGARRARGLIQAGARHVRVVSPAFDPSMPDEVERVAERYGRRHLEGASLAMAAADDPAVNDAVVRDARSMRIWVSRADGGDIAEGGFITPARHEAGPVVMAISAGSPTVSAWLRDRLAERLEGRYVRLAEAVESLRRSIVARPDLDAATRRQMLRDLVSDEAIAALDRGDEAGLAHWLAGRYPQWKP